MYENYTQDEITLAQEFAHALSDYDSMVFHLDNARKFKESFLRKQLEYVLTRPHHKIKTSRAAYYTFLIHQKATEHDLRH